MNIENLFAGFDTKDSYAVLFIMLIAFLLGFLVAWLLRAAALRQQRQATEEAVARQAQAEAQLSAAQSLLQERNQELQTASRERVDLLDQVQRYEAEKASYYTELSQLKGEIERLKGSARTYTATIDELNEQIASMSVAPQVAVPAVPIAEVHSTDVPPAVLAVAELPADRLAQFEQRLESLATENLRLRDDLTQVQQQQALDHQTTLERLEEKISRLESENQQLVGQLSNWSAAADVAPSATLGMAAIPLVIATEPEADFAADKSVLQDRLVEDDRQRDDLTLITGIGPFLESQLNQIGVLTWADIAGWDAARIAEITEAISFFPGRIEKDNWVGQAQQLLQQTPPSATAAEETSATAPIELPTEADAESAPIPSLPSSDDLTQIEGIGPKIEALLKGVGIRTWSDLAATDPGLLRELLDNAGDQFRIHAPYTWPLQARLAAAGRWDELREYQLELRGGKDVNP